MLVDLPGDAEERVIYRRVVNHLRQLILEGALAPGAKIPAQRVLAKDLKVSRNTVVTALEQLASEGFLETRIGSGTYVSAEISPFRASSEGRRLSATRTTAVPLEAGIFDPALFPLDDWNLVQSKRWKRMPRAALQEEHPTGWPGLREILGAQVCASRGLAYSPSQVIIVPTAQAAVELAARTLSSPGDIAWVEDPGYFRARAALSSAGLNVQPIPVDKEGFDVGKALATSTAKLAYVTPGAQIPTGVTMSPARRAELLAWAKSADAWVIEDDFEADFWFDKRPPPPLAAEPNSERVVYVGTLNSLMFPSLRVAYLVAPPQALDRIVAGCAGAGRTMNFPLQVVLQDFMEQGYLASHIRACRDAFAGRRRVLLNALQEQFALPFEIGTPAFGLIAQLWLPPGVSDMQVRQVAGERGVVVNAMSEHALLPTRPGLFLGFAPYAPQAIERAVFTLAESIRTLGN